jgi:hypothetical protein
VSDTQVEYGTTTAYGSSSSLNGTLVRSHAVPMAGLLPSTVYHCRAISRDAAGNRAVSGDYVFTTPALGMTTTAEGTTTSAELIRRPGGLDGESPSSAM